METGELVFAKSIVAQFDNGQQRGSATWKSPKGQMMVFAALGTCKVEKMGSIDINKCLQGWGWVSPDDAEEVAADHRDLVRQLDVLLNGEAGAAKQATLSDIVAQVRREHIKAPDYTVHQHPDDVAIDRFAAAMKARMAEKRAEGHNGWDNPDLCSVGKLESALKLTPLRRPIDIGNYAMMLFIRNLA